MSKSNVIIVLGLVLIVGVGLLFSNSELFKGQLGLNPGANPDLTLEVSNCGLDECISPGLILNTAEQLENVELLVKSALDSEVVYAEYLPLVEAGTRYEIAFDKSICGTYTFDSLTSQYSVAAPEACTDLTFDFIVSGAAGNSSLPVFTEFASFTLSE